MEKGKIIQESIWNAVLWSIVWYRQEIMRKSVICTSIYSLASFNWNTAGFTCVLLYICDMSVCLGCVLYIALTFQCISTFGCMKCSDSVMSCAERSGRGFRVSLPSGEITYLHTGSGREELPRFLQAVCRSTGGHPWEIPPVLSKLL